MSFFPYLGGFLLGNLAGFIYIFWGEAATVSFMAIGLFTTLLVIYEEMKR